MTDEDLQLDTDGPAGDDASSTGPDAAAAPAPADAAGGRGVAFWAGWALAVVGLAASAVLAVLLLQARDAEGARAEVEQTAGQFALSLTAWDASDGMAGTREELRSQSSGRFASEVDELFGGTDDLAELEQIGARSQAEVDEVLVERVDGDTAEVLVVVLQRVTTEVTDGEEVSLRYARLGLVREDGAWRVDRVELLVDLLQEAAERTPGAPLPGELDLDDAEDAG